MKSPSLTAGVLTLSLMAFAPARAQPVGCVASGVADLQPPTRWLGRCVDGLANGLGVIRAGVSAPYGFFAGRMTKGRPGAGVIILRNGLFEVAASFEARGKPIDTDSLHPELQDAVFALAARAARATADRFRSTGNRASADYYKRLADRIEHSLPE